MKTHNSKPTTATTTLQRFRNVYIGSFRAALGALPRSAAETLIEEARSTNRCVAVVLADFYAKHHQADK